MSSGQNIMQGASQTALQCPSKLVKVSLPEWLSCPFSGLNLASRRIIPHISVARVGKDACIMVGIVVAKDFEGFIHGQRPSAWRAEVEYLHGDFSMTFSTVDVLVWVEQRRPGAEALYIRLGGWHLSLV